MASPQIDPRNMPMCPLAKRIAAPKKTGTIRQQTEATLAHHALVSCINLLHYFPEERVAAERYIMASVEEKLRESRFGEGSFDNISTIGALDDAWVIGWISGKTQLPSDALRKALMFDRKSINNVFCFMLGVLPQVKLPTGCESKQFLCFMADVLWAQRGKPLESQNGSPPSIILEDGQVDTASLVYELRYEAAAGRVVRVIHRRAGHAVDVDADVRITAAFHLKDGWSDGNATLSNGKQCHYLLHQFFAESHGPHVQPELKGKARDLDAAVRHAQTLMDELERRKAAGRVSDGSTEVVAAVSEEKKRARTEKARAALAARKQETTKRRRVAIVVTTT